MANQQYNQGPRRPIPNFQPFGDSFRKALGALMRKMEPMADTSCYPNGRRTHLSTTEFEQKVSVMKEALAPDIHQLVSSLLIDRGFRTKTRHHFPYEKGIVKGLYTRKNVGKRVRGDDERESSPPRRKIDRRESPPRRTPVRPDSPRKPRSETFARTPTPEKEEKEIKPSTSKTPSKAIEALEKKEQTKEVKITQANYGQILFDQEFESTFEPSIMKKYDQLVEGLWPKGYGFLSPGRPLVQEKIDIIVDRHRKDKMTWKERKESKEYSTHAAHLCIQRVKKTVKHVIRDPHPPPRQGDREIALEAFVAVRKDYGWSVDNAEQFWSQHVKSHHKKLLDFIEHAERKQKKYEEKRRREEEVQGEAEVLDLFPGSPIPSISPKSPEKSPEPMEIDQVALEPVVEPPVVKPVVKKSYAEILKSRSSLPKMQPMPTSPKKSPPKTLPPRTDSKVIQPKSRASEAVANRIAKAPGLTTEEVDVMIKTAMETMKREHEAERARWAELTTLSSPSSVDTNRN